jgi:uncharacterized membrane protein
LAAGLVLLLLVQQLNGIAMLRSALSKRFGSGAYAIGVGALVLAGLALVLAGKSHAAYTYVWLPPIWLHLLVLPLMFVAFIFLAAGVVPSNLRRFTRRPALWGAVLGAVAHLLILGDLAAITLFGGIIVLALMEIGSLKRRGAPRSPRALPWANESLTIGVGGLSFIAFFYLHAGLFGAPASMMGYSPL